MTKKVIVIGGGAAGFFAAIHAKERFPDSEVIIIEKSKTVLAKVSISGGGRCNVTHACFDPKQLVDFYPRGRKELMGPFHRFQPQDTMEWFESRGVSLKIESDNRVFPISDQSQDIVDCLIQTAQKLGIKLWTECSVQTVNVDETREDKFLLRLSSGESHRCSRLILATGSSRKGYALAASLGHHIVDPVPSLFTFKVDDPELKTLAGVSVNETRVLLRGIKKSDQEGPLLITHWGLSGPAIIKLSAWFAKELHALNYKTTCCVNWLPQYSQEECLSHLKKQQASVPNQNIDKHSPFSQLSNRLWAYLLKRSLGESKRSWKSVSDKHFDVLAELLVNTQFEVNGKGVFKEEFVTCGGVDLKEIEFKTMESKLCKGLFVVGELLDCDGVTGGFNFQNAWTTGWIAGSSC